MCLIYNSIDLTIEWKLAITREPQGSTRDIKCVCGMLGGTNMYLESAGLESKPMEVV